MHPHLKKLIDLQAVDLRLIEIRERLSRFPKRLAEVEARVTAARQQVSAAKEALTASLKERKKWELDVEQWKDRARKYRDQSSEVKTNEAYRALQHEIQNAEQEVARAEDRLLDRMVAGEQYEHQVKAAEAAVKEVEATANQGRHAIQAEYQAAQKELAAAEAMRAEVVGAVPPDLVQLFERIAKRHGGIALAELRGESCGQCGVHVRPHVIQLLQRPNTEEIFKCETCTRILYYPEQALAQAQQAAVSSSVESPPAGEAGSAAPTSDS